MKKTFYQIGMLAVAALAFVSCQREADYKNEKEEVKHVAIVTLGKAEETKTAVVEGDKASYIWTEGDQAYITVYENGKEGVIDSFLLSDDYTIATLTVSFSGDAPSVVSYSAIYAKTISNGGNPLIQNKQYPEADNFDPSADILISKPTADVTNLNSRPETLRFILGRPVTVNKMTLTGLEEGEVVKSVEFELDQYMAGYYNISNGTYSTITGGKKLTFDYTKDNPEDDITIGSDGEFPVYFISAPVSDAKIERVVVTTDKNLYTKAGNIESTDPFYGKTISFAVGTMTRFKMGMSGYGEPISDGVDYTLVSSNGGLVSGAKYIIVGNGNKAMSTQSTNNRSTVDVAANNGVITVDSSIAANVFMIEENGSNYTIKDVTPGATTENQYLYAPSSTNNYLRSNEEIVDNAKWNIVITDGVASIINANNTGRGVMCLNGSLISAYASLGSYKTLALYVDLTTCIEALATPVIIADANGSTITVVWDDVENASSYLVTCTGEQNQTINPGVEEATFTNLEDGTYTVTVTAISNDYSVYKDSAAASVEVIVGTPALAAPVISTFEQTSTGFSAEISAAVENATSYDWDLYEGSVVVDNLIGEGNTTNLSFDVEFDAIEDIDAFKPGTTYYLVITAKADGYTEAASDPASFEATTIMSYSWVETALSDLTADDVFVIVGNSSYAIANDLNTSSGGPQPVSVTVSDTELTGIIPENIMWTLSGNSTNGYSFYSNANSANFLYCSTTAVSSNNDNMRVGPTGDRHYFILDSGHLKTKDTYTARYIGLNGTSDFRGYTSSSTNPVTFKFYKYTINDGKSDANISYARSSDVITYGVSLTPPALIGAEGFTISCVSDNQNVATVNASGAINVVGNAGTAHITVSWDEQEVSSTIYRAGSTSYTLTVNKATPTIAEFSNPTTVVAVSGTVTNTTTIDYGLAIVYTTSDPTVASIDASTGEVTGLADGTATISATFTENDNFYAATPRSYTITVGEGGGGGSSVTVSMDTFSEISGYVDGDQNVSYEATKGGAQTAPAVNSNEIRIYQNGGLLTISANNSKTITNVTIGSSMATKVQVKLDDGAYSSDNNISANGTFSTGSISASTVVFKCTGTDKNSRLYLNSLSVTYE